MRITGAVLWFSYQYEACVPYSYTAETFHEERLGAETFHEERVGHHLDKDKSADSEELFRVMWPL